MADYYGTDTVVSELREDGLLIIRINRPEVANALNGATSDAMENIMNHAEKDKAVRAIIVTGTGKVFCAGEDLSELSEGGECQTVTEHGFGGITNRLFSKPLICAMNGSAAGGGMEIAVSCDMVVANETAKMGCTEVGLGIIASTGGLVRLARDINRKDCNLEKLLLDYVYEPDSVRETMQAHTPFFEKCCTGIYYVGAQGATIADQSKLRELAADPHVLETVLFYQEGEQIDNYGAKPYLARYYVGADTREELDRVTEAFFENASVADPNGVRVDLPFVLEQD